MNNKLPTLTTGLFALLLAAPAARAQPSMDECEKLKIQVAKLKFENANLRKGIISRSPASPPPQLTGGQPTASTPAPTSLPLPQTVDKVKFTLVKCQGNAKSQTVTVTLLLTNAAANRDLQFEKVKAVDAQGEEYQTFDIHIGAGGIRNNLATGVPIKTVFVIPKVLQTTKSLKVLSCSIYDNANPGRTVGIEFRDVAVAWK